MIQLKINNMDHKAILTFPADYERVVLALWTIGLDRDPEKYTLRQLDAEFTYTTEEESQMVRLIDPKSSLTRKPLEPLFVQTIRESAINM